MCRRFRSRKAAAHAEKRPSHDGLFRAAGNALSLSLRHRRLPPLSPMRSLANDRSVGILSRSDLLLQEVGAYGQGRHTRKNP